MPLQSVLRQLEGKAAATWMDGTYERAPENSPGETCLRAYA
jgi:hypothetical protein